MWGQMEPRFGLLQTLRGRVLFVSVSSQILGSWSWYHPSTPAWAEAVFLSNTSSWAKSAVFLSAMHPGWPPDNKQQLILYFSLGLKVWICFIFQIFKNKSGGDILTKQSLWGCCNSYFDSESIQSQRQAECSLSTLLACMWKVRDPTSGYYSTMSVLSRFISTLLCSGTRKVDLLIICQKAMD